MPSAHYEFSGKALVERHEINLAGYMKTGQDRDELLEEAQKITKALEKIAKR